MNSVLKHPRDRHGINAFLPLPALVSGKRVSGLCRAKEPLPYVA